MKTLFLMTFALLVTMSAFAETDVLGGKVLGSANALTTFFNNLNQMKYKTKVFRGKTEVVEAPLSQFLGDVLADTSRIEREQGLLNISQSSVQDGGCRYVTNTPPELKYKVTVCTIWIDKRQGPKNISRYTISFKSTAIGQLGEVQVDNDSITRTVEILKEDGSFGNLIKLE